MHIFTDNKKRTWTVVIDVAAAQRIKAMLGIDLMDALGGGFMKKLAADPALLGNLLFVLCEKQAAERAVPERKFRAALTGSLLLAAFCAFTSELVSFFPEGEKEAKTDDQRPTTDDHSCTSDDCWSLVWQHAGILGVNPGPFTLRELCVMSKARKKDEWTRTSASLAMLHNINRDPKKCEARTPDYFNPFAERKTEKRVVDSKLAFKIMKDTWCGGEK